MPGGAGYGMPTPWSRRGERATRPLTSCPTYREPIMAQRTDTTVIGSLKHPRLREARSLGTRAQREEAGRWLLEGRALIGQSAEAGYPLLYVLRAQSAVEDEDRELERALERSGVAVHLVTAGVLRQVAGASHPVSWCAVASAPVELGPTRRGESSRWSATASPILATLARSLAPPSRSASMTSR
jgi:MRM3-like substrate binding domain